MTRFTLVLAFVAASVLPAHAQAVQARAAELVRVSGTVEVQRAPPSGGPQSGQAAWTPARSGQELQRGDSLRTYSASVAQLTFAGAVQWQLSAESQLNLAEALAGGSGAIVVRLERGGAVSRWTPDRRTSAPKMVVQTPAGEATITGTEYSILVDGSGRTSVLVLEGTVELTNDRGTVVARENESAEVRPGAQPSMIRVLNPSDRVQWIAAYVPTPERYTVNASAATQAIVRPAM